MSWSVFRRLTRYSTGLTAGCICVGILSQSLTRSISAESREPQKIFKGGPIFLSLPLESCELVNHNTKRLRFKLPGENCVSGLPLTSALLTLSWPKTSWTPVLRPYTPVSSSADAGFLDLIVKHYPNGKVSTHLHSLKEGDTLMFAAPLKGYFWKANEFSHITLIAGGAGITPIFQLTQGILRNPLDSTAITLVFGVQSDADLLLQKEIDQFSKKFPDRLNVTYVISKPSEGSPHRKGYITKELLEEVLPQSRVNTKVFICGPPPLEHILTGKRLSSGILGELGFQKDQIYKF
ncbi:uncharacterized protein V1516DRAFT_646539 [Lipomyces oligophaga]|uniref:uncharacterized protein n=1 Tax=Lipomyces oligophaga TaxID=45792 RepID=UPI0034CF7557